MTLRDHLIIFALALAWFTIIFIVSIPVSMICQHLYEKFGTAGVFIMFPVIFMVGALIGLVMTKVLDRIWG
ncbi:MAG: hypothetical protein DRP08_07325 [Candidatus Aenigmatarchaeota archaeon]|nr:MAG: hypothetical protein DRP08_07325 [Candidatus Aenigmarchaeota archaeon]